MDLEKTQLKETTDNLNLMQDRCIYSKCLEQENHCQEFVSGGHSVGGGGSRRCVSSKLSPRAPVDSSYNSMVLCFWRLQSETGFSGDTLCPVYCAGWRLGEGETFTEGLGVSL